MIFTTNITVGKLPGRVRVVPKSCWKDSKSYSDRPEVELGVFRSGYGHTLSHVLVYTKSYSDIPLVMLYRPLAVLYSFLGMKNSNI